MEAADGLDMRQKGTFKLKDIDQANNDIWSRMLDG